MNIPVGHGTLRALVLFAAIGLVASAALARWTSYCQRGGGTLYSTGDGSSCWYTCVGGKYNGWSVYDGRKANPSKPEAAAPTCATNFTLKIQTGPDVCASGGRTALAAEAKPTCARGKLAVDADETKDLCDLREGKVKLHAPAPQE